MIFAAAAMKKLVKKPMIKCPGSGDCAAGHRYWWRLKLVACARCKAWFSHEKLVFPKDIMHVTGFIPDHKLKLK